MISKVYSFVFVFFFKQVNLTIEEHTRELLALNRKFGITLLDAVTLLQESDSFLESVKVRLISSNHNSEHLNFHI